MSEDASTTGRTFFQEGDVAVTSGRLCAAGQSYTLNSVRSVEIFREAPPMAGPVVMAVAGVLSISAVLGEAGARAVLVGAALLVAAGVWWRQKKPSFGIRLHTPDGEATAVESRDPACVERVAAALDEAMQPN